MDSFVENNDIEQEEASDELLNTNHNDLKEFYKVVKKIVYDDKAFKNDKLDFELCRVMFLFEDIEKAEDEFSRRLKIYVKPTFDSIKLFFNDSFDKEHYFILEYSPKNYRITEHTLPELDTLNAEFKGTIHQL